TGREAPPGQVVLRWLHLEYDEGALSLASPEPVEIAAARADAEWDGLAWLQPTSGRLVARDAAYVAAGERASLDGAFRATLAPSGDALELAGLEGDLRATSLRRERVPAPLVPASLGPVDA